MMSFTKTFICILLLPFFGSLTQAQEEIREWSSAVGNYKIQASFAGRDGNTISLEKADGSIVKIELSKLSEADQRFLETIEATKTAPAATPGKVKTKPLVSGASELSYPEPGFWDITPDPFVSSVKTISEPISLGDEERVTGKLLMSPKRSTLMYFDEKDHVTTGLRIFDMTTGKLVAPRETVPECVPIDISPDESRIVVATLSRRRKPNMLHVLVRGAKLAPLASWQPYGEQGSATYAQFVDNNHLLTVSEDGHMGLWNVNTLKLMWKTLVWPASRPALSPNRKLLFARVEKGLAAIEPLSGKILGLQGSDVIGLRQLSVNDSCTTLVGVGNGTVRRWDLSTGNQVADFAISSAILGGEVKWVSDHQFLASSRNKLHDLVDLDLMCSMWVYQFKAEPAIGADGQVWFGTSQLGKVFQPRLACDRLPHPEAAAAIQRTSATSLTTLNYGATVPMSLNISGGLWNRSAVQDNASKMMKDSGFSLSLNGGNPAFHAKLGNIEIVDVENGNRFQDNSQVDLTLVANGKAIWRPDRDWALYTLGEQPFNEHPWKGYVIPKLFRFYKPVLDASTPTVDQGYAQVFYDRDYSEGFAEGWSSSAEGLQEVLRRRAQNNTPENYRSPGFPGGPPGRSGTKNNRPPGLGGR